MVRTLECIMIISLNYLAYPHACLLCVQNAVDPDSRGCFQKLA